MNTPSSPHDAPPEAAIPEPEGWDDDALPRAPRFRVHMALAHFPCGLFATSLVLHLLGATALAPQLGPSAKVCFFAGAVALPLVMVSGVLTWKTRRRSGGSGVFRMKLVWTLLLLAAATATAVPELYQGPPTEKFPFGVAICTALAAVLARMGTMIVFGRIGESGDTH